MGGRQKRSIRQKLPLHKVQCTVGLQLSTRNAPAHQSVVLPGPTAQGFSAGATVRTADLMSAPCPAISFPFDSGWVLGPDSAFVNRDPRTLEYGLTG